MTIENLQPGSELDERLAKALGWKTIRDTESGYRYGMWVPPKADRYREEPLSYSTDDATALATLQQLWKEKGWNWAMYSPDIEDSKFVVGIVHYSGESEISLAHAASLAMLAALEAEE